MFGNIIDVQDIHIEYCGENPGSFLDDPDDLFRIAQNTFGLGPTWIGARPSAV